MREGPYSEALVAEIELTDAQQQILRARQGRRIDVVDPATRERYVLLPQEQYKRVQPLREQAAAPSPEPLPGIAPLLLRSMQAYWRDLPELLQAKSRQWRWVGYHAEERIGFGKTEAELYQEAFRRGLQRGEFYVGILEADPEGIPPWGTIESDWSLYEADESTDFPPKGA
jgi:hypothetical protein